MSIFQNTPSNTISTLNSRDTYIRSGVTFTGTAEDVSKYGSVIVAVKTDQDGTYTVEFSTDGTNWDSVLTNYYRTTNVEPPHRYTITRKYFRIVFTNTSAVDQTYLRLQVTFGDKTDLNAPLDSVIAPDFDSVSVRPSSYNHEVALALRNGKTHWDIWGYNADVDTGTEVVRSSGGTTVALTTVPTTYTFVSTSANDTSGGTGANSLVVYYIDDDRKAQIGVITMNGTTPVVSAFTGLGINRISIYLAGSGQKNAGVITCTETTGGANVAQMPLNAGTNQTTVFYTQENYTTLITPEIFINLVKASGGGTAPIVIIKGWVFSFVSNAYYEVFSITLDSSVIQYGMPRIGDPFPIGEKSVFWFEATTDQNNTTVSIRYSLTESRDINA